VNPVIICNATLHLGDCIEVMAVLPSELNLLAKKVFAQLEEEVLNEWVSSEVALSTRSEVVISTRNEEIALI